jgi:flagellar protein FlgJ
MDSTVTKAGATAFAGANPRDTPEKIQKAAKDFEALLIGQMLKSVRESSFGGGWGTSDQTGDVALDMAEQQMAQLMASNGGLGLSRLISQGLEKSAVKTTSGTTAPPTITRSPMISTMNTQPANTPPK